MRAKIAVHDSDSWYLVRYFVATFSRYIPGRQVPVRWRALCTARALAKRLQCAALVSSDVHSTANRSPDRLDERRLLQRSLFVGREGELRELQTVFDSAATGHGELVMLVG